MSGLTDAEVVHHESTDTRDFELAKRIASVLMGHYPGWLWMVSTNMRGGLIDISCAQLDARFAYTIKLSGLFSWDNLRDSVVRAGGEILERYRQPRGQFKVEDYESLARGVRGIALGDVEDVLPGNQRIKEL